MYTHWHVTPDIHIASRDIARRPRRDPGLLLDLDLDLRRSTGASVIPSLVCQKVIVRLHSSDRIALWSTSTIPVAGSEAVLSHSYSTLPFRARYDSNLLGQHYGTGTYISTLWFVISHPIRRVARCILYSTKYKRVGHPDSCPRFSRYLTNFFPFSRMSISAPLLCPVTILPLATHNAAVSLK